MTAIEASAREKQAHLRRILEQMGSVIVAFSGGVDSAYLAVEAHHVLGQAALAVTGESPSYPEYQRAMALRIVEQFGLRHRFIATDEIHNAAYLANNADRCFHCKTELYTELGKLARAGSFRFMIDGANADDRTDFRPGRQAAQRLGVRSPLDEAELTKSEIRHLSETLALPTASEPASACLSSRVPYQTPITIQTLDQVEQGETILRRMGFRQVRVRHHDTLARLEFAPDELDRALTPEVRTELIRELKSIGYKFVTIDLEGYRMGSLNEALPQSEHKP